MDDGRRVYTGIWSSKAIRIRLPVPKRTRRAAPDGAEWIDGQRALFMPGLVNTHGHAAMSLLRGYADDRRCRMAGAIRCGRWKRKFTAEDVRWGAALAAVEMLKSGTTTFVDMYDQMDLVGGGGRSRPGIRGC